MDENKYLSGIKKWLIVLVLLVITNVWLFRSYADFQLNAGSRIEVDALNYIQMSQNSRAVVSNPFIFRVMSPRIVHWLVNEYHINLDSGWQILTVIATILTELIFFIILNRSIKFSFLSSLIFTLFLSVTYWFTLFNYQDVWLVDPLNNLFSMLVLWTLLEERYFWFVIVLAIAVFNKEVILLWLPLYPIMVGIKDRTIWSTRFWVAVGISVLLVWLYWLWRHQLINVAEPVRSPNPLLGQNQTVVGDIRSAFKYYRDPFDLFHLFDFLWFIAFYVCYRLFQDYGWRNRLVIMLCYFSVVLTTATIFVTDIPRAISTITPVVLICGALLFHQRESKQTRFWLFLSFFVYLLINLSWGLTLGDPATLSRTVIVIADIGVIITLARVFLTGKIKSPERLTF